MSLTKEFFDNIQIELVKRKYYNSNKVDALINDIRCRARVLMEENARLSAELDTYTSQKAQIADAVMNAQLLHTDIVEKANRQADDKAAQAEESAKLILSEANEQAKEIIDAARADAEKLLEEAQDKIKYAEEMQLELDKLKQQQIEYAVDKMEGCFSKLRQRHLEAIEALNLQWQEFLCGLYDEDAEAAPADLSEKVDAIAKELGEMDCTTV
ncbi:MAG: hypothetical protein IJB09_04335 [Oscillospiraceae bacterium]|nr:hypothetical protein [Oscillospiraceae bacterium]